VFNRLLPERIIEFDRHIDFDAVVGDELTLGVSEKILLQVSAFVYLSPLLMMILFASFAQVIFFSDLLTVISALLGVLFGFLLARFVQYQWLLRWQPTVLCQSHAGDAADRNILQ
jgi:positive regulator of sigma E activity